jgi:hypothetical protein
MEGFMRLIVLLVVLGAFVAPARAQSREITGQAGFLGEWELTATVTARAANGSKELVGPLSLKHVGVCTQDGPEEKTGELRLRISDSSARVKAILLIEGTECTYDGHLETSYDGVMSCPDRRGIPLRLRIK